jgi:beta-glucosidase/6-phospho-beta-glucosidase/beta-galactosidase
MSTAGVSRPYRRQTTIENRNHVTAAKHKYPYFGSFESTRLSKRRTDILGTTRHIEFWREDLQRLYESNLIDLRYPIPWHRIEREPGVFDWRWIDGPMSFLRDHGMRPVVDPIHHISYPTWLTGGFANPDFGRLYQRFVMEFAQRYDWVDQYTVFNEPLPTTILCSYMGVWDPCLRSDRDFVAMSVAVSRAICSVTEALTAFNPNIRFVHVDTCETHSPLDDKSVRYATYAQHRRFLLHDLVLGCVDREYPLYGYLKENGFREEDEGWLRDHRGRFDVLALDYYPHCEMEWVYDRRWRRTRLQRPARSPRGFAALALEYAQRFRVPVMLGETNIRGSIRDRIAWLRYMEQQCELVHEQTDFRGFCWFPSIDSTDWCSLCRRARKRVDPQGIWSLEPDRKQRVHTELTDYYVGLAQGRMTWRDLPDYEFEGLWHQALAGFYPLMEVEGAAA